MLKTRIWKYAIHPTDMQRSVLEEAGIKSRVLWNRLVSETQWAIHECENGRRANVENVYINLLANKNLVGKRVVEVQKVMARDNVSKDVAVKTFIQEKSAKDIAIKRRKDGSRYLRYSHKHLSRLYAVEYVNQMASHILKDGTSQIWHGIARKWNDFCQMWEQGKFDKPRFKKYNQISALQKQISETSKFSWDEKSVNLSWLGSPCLESVAVTNDRPLPQGSKIVQVAVVKSSTNQWFVCLFLLADETVFARQFPLTGKIVGIDPGLKTALTTSEGETLHPNGLSRDLKLDGRIKKLSRKLDRQTRACNLHCFNPDGTWKRGQRVTKRSRGMAETALSIACIKQYFSDSKSNYYHNAAIALLNQFDTIGIGNAKIHTLARGKGQSKRSQNRVSREHAIADFVSKVKDKASLSLTPKSVYVIVEAYTTQTCSQCGEKTGPSGQSDLSIRKWTCSKRGAEHDRDTNAAINIKNKTISEMKAAASQAVSETKVSKVRRSTTGKIAERSRPRSTETIASQDDGPMSIPVASA